MSTQDLKRTVREKYGLSALAVKDGIKSSCCPSSCCGGAADDPISSDLYTQAQASILPEKAILASLGCGNPTALIELQFRPVPVRRVQIVLAAQRRDVPAHAVALRHRETAQVPEEQAVDRMLEIHLRVPRR